MLRSQANCARSEGLCPDRPNAEGVLELLAGRAGGSPRLVCLIRLGLRWPTWIERVRGNSGPPSFLLTLLPSYSFFFLLLPSSSFFFLLLPSSSFFFLLLPSSSFLLHLLSHAPLFGALG